MIPCATYRFQFHAKFPFARAEALVPYLDRLGISHIYASPVTVAVPGSQHGYDVVDPTRINPELGGEEGLRSLVAALHRRGMGLIIDIVPNHMGVAGGHNAWWNDVLRYGQDSEFARFFDVDWREPLFLPILGAPLHETIAAGGLAVDRTGGDPVITAYGEHRLPLRREDTDALPDDGDHDGLAALLDRQHYRLGWWRQANDWLNWRRFFTINDLAGLRVEDDAVFEATHALYFRLWQEGLIDGVRIDHVDGLTDPAAYCRKLRCRFDALARPAGLPPGPAYVVVEKILAPGEVLPDDWGVDGTSGYDFMEEVSAVLHDPGGVGPLVQTWQDFTGESADFHALELRARREMLDWAFGSQLDSCVDAFANLARVSAKGAGFTQGMLRRAISRMLWVFPVYRTYGTGDDAPASDAAIRARVQKAAARFTPPGEAEVTDFILHQLAGEGAGHGALAAEAVRRFQQLSAPIAAKAVEDTAFYRYGVLASRLDVGFDATRLACSIGDFHGSGIARAKTFPHTMLATATHDHKRGEDVRARLAVLSVIPDIWRARVGAWDENAEGGGSDIAAADRYMLYQMVFGCWPADLDAGDAAGLSRYADRLCAWQVKALREGKQRSSWVKPNEDYEGRAEAFTRRLLQANECGNIVCDAAAFVADTAGATLANMLVQTALRCTVPGIPDCYQGCELPDFSMVDPDNRRPVDFEQRERMLRARPASHPKLEIIADLLALRRREPVLFATGYYRPVEVAGPQRAHVLAFERWTAGAVLQCAMAVRCGGVLMGSADPVPPPSWWEDTSIAFEDAGGSGGGGETAAAVIFGRSPVFARMVSQTGSGSD